MIVLDGTKRIKHRVVARNILRVSDPEESDLHDLKCACVVYLQDGGRLRVMNDPEQIRKLINKELGI